MIAWMSDVNRIFIASVLLIGTVAATSSSANGLCTVKTRVATVAELPEASGAAASRRTPGLIWSHNDSGEPVLFALDASGAVKGRVRVNDVEVNDWEAVAAGPCPQGSCLYISDIGDNNRRCVSRRRRTRRGRNICHPSVPAWSTAVESRSQSRQETTWPGHPTRLTGARTDDGRH